MQNLTQTRVTTAKLSSILSAKQPEESLNVLRLNVSQATALSNADSLLAKRVDEHIASKTMRTTDESCLILDNDGTNAGVFLDLGICDRFLTSDGCMSWAEFQSVAENVIMDFPSLINPFRNTDETYEPIAAYSILRNNNLINGYSLSEEFVEPGCQTVFQFLDKTTLPKSS